MAGDEEDTVAQTDPSWRLWKAGLCAQTNCLRMVLKVADFLDTNREEDMSDDAEFEDCELDEGEEEEENVIDLDEFKKQCVMAVFTWLPQILQRTQPTPHVIGLARHAEDALDELQETAFAILTSLLFSDLPKVREGLVGH